LTDCLPFSKTLVKCTFIYGHMVRPGAWHIPCIFMNKLGPNYLIRLGTVKSSNWEYSLYRNACHSLEWRNFAVVSYESAQFLWNYFEKPPIEMGPNLQTIHCVFSLFKPMPLPCSIFWSYCLCCLSGNRSSLWVRTKFLCHQTHPKFVFF
jgi:hypothetical protein